MKILPGARTIPPWGDPDPSADGWEGVLKPNAEDYFKNERTLKF